VLEAKEVSVMNASRISGSIELGLIAGIALPVMLSFQFEFGGVQKP
jgi:hypothetical protein